MARSPYAERSRAEMSTTTEPEYAGEEGPPFPFSVPDLTALFANGYEIVADYVPDVAFRGREGRERLRVLRRDR